MLSMCTPRRNILPLVRYMGISRSKPGCGQSQQFSSDIPTFPTFKEHHRHILTHMAATFRYFTRQNYVEGQSGHISVRDPKFPNLMWMNPLSRHFGMLIAGDMLCIDISSGEIVREAPNPTTGGRTANMAGYYIHSAVYLRRLDIHAICHAHGVSGRAWSDVCNFYGNFAVYDAYNGVVFGPQEGINIAEALGSNKKAATLMNHDLLTCGETVDEAGFMFGLLERPCEIQLQAEAAAANGIAKKIITDEEAAYNSKMASEKNSLYREA
ncbi:hypothetical protein LCI18_007497 [Fusarium solani-melongenae]|uniref:Uncharacterized protein n=1 Tax=Fusarium solani subsp. cucurbitae TaxID=2747967 RepID=A0ACD3Z640_FUSSC|nr:hypothetical protein LCI18_007497 [Fusarium solani-melongenae]